MRIHALENVQRAIDFLHEKKVPMENIGNHDIVDGNHRIILGLIWTIILRFQVNYPFLYNEVRLPDGRDLYTAPCGIRTK